MGLAVSVGRLAEAIQSGDQEWVASVRGEFNAISSFLKKKKLKTFKEPEMLPTRLKTAWHVSGFSYSCLHYLRRFYVVAQDHEDHPEECRLYYPRTKAEIKEADERVQDSITMFTDHLLCHSDSEGYYIPIDFSEVLFVSDDKVPGGGILGSSVRLMGELVWLAKYLGIKLRAGKLPAKEHEKLKAAIEADEEPGGTEKMVWLTLFENARISVAHQTAIHFG